MNDNLKILRASSSFFCMTLVWSAQTALAADRELGFDCVTIAAADERLACFDAAYGVEIESGTSALETTAVAAATAGTAVAASTPASPTPTPAAADFGLKKSPEEIEGERLVSRVTRVDKDPFDKLVVYLENGQVWKQNENKRLTLKEGDVAIIRHGAFGSYRLSAEGKSRSTKVKRLR